MRRAVPWLLAIVGAALAQDSRPAAPSGLRAALEAYLAERDDAAAARLLDDLVRRPDATADDMSMALTTCDAPIAPESTVLVPYRNQLLAMTLKTPAGHSRSAARLPVVFDIAEGDMGSWLELDKDVVVAFVKGYKPEQFSDEGRDAFVKLLRTAAHQGHGDSDRLWFLGFSWAGHASYEMALHRPGIVRGIVPMAGGPRRAWFRLFQQLPPIKVAAFCGGKDDPELLWTLHELERLAPSLKLDYTLKVDPAMGHDMPLAGTDKIRRMIKDTPTFPPPQPTSGTLLADGALVESPLLRVDGVDEVKVAVPKGPIPVSGDLSPDGQRRAAIKSMAAKVAKIKWKIEETKTETLVTLDGDGVVTATLFLREPAFKPGHKVTVKSNGKTVFSAVLAADPKTMAAEARRTGDRARPVLRAIEIR